MLKCSKDFFAKWIKFQSKDPFNEHFDHALPIHFFKQFSEASRFNSLRDSWININPLLARDNLSKSSNVDIYLFKTQLNKAKTFISSYQFKNNIEKQDILKYYNHICDIFYELTALTDIST